MRDSASKNWGNNRSHSTWMPVKRRQVFATQRFDFSAFNTTPPGFVSLRQFLDDHITPSVEETLPEIRRQLAKEVSPVNLTALRLQAGLNQSQLASLIGTSQPRLSSWECGQDSPSLDNILKLATALETDFNTLIEAIVNAKRKR